MSDVLASTTTDDLRRQFDAADAIARAAEIVQEVVASTPDQATKARLNEATDLLLSAARTVVETTTHSTQSLSGSIKLQLAMLGSLD